jgi:hypothetical protein
MVQFIAKERFPQEPTSDLDDLEQGLTQCAVKTI